MHVLIAAQLIYIIVIIIYYIIVFFVGVYCELVCYVKVVQHFFRLEFQSTKWLQSILFLFWEYAC